MISLREYVGSIIDFHPRNQDVDFVMLEMFLALHILNMARSAGLIQNFSGDTPLDHIWHAQIRAQIQPNTVIGVNIWARQIWSGGCP